MILRSSSFKDNPNCPLNLACSSTEIEFDFKFELFDVNQTFIPSGFSEECKFNNSAKEGKNDPYRQKFLIRIHKQGL